MDKKAIGERYENSCANLLKQMGFSNVTVTKGSGDQGVDITAYKGGVKYAVQCKKYSKPVSNSAVQQVVAGMNYYHCSKAIVMTNNKFTQSAKDLAKANGVELWPYVEFASASTPKIKSNKSSKTIKKSRNSSKTNTYKSKSSSSRSHKRRASEVSKKGIIYAAVIAVLLVILIVFLRTPALWENNIFSNLSTNSTETVSATTSNNNYILADSDSRYYTESELSSLTKDELRLARNEIYARHGRKFDSEDLQEYFGNQSWYKGTIEPSDFSESLLNEYERANVDTIMAVEETK